VQSTPARECVEAHAWPGAPRYSGRRVPSSSPPWVECRFGGQLLKQLPFPGSGFGRHPNFYHQETCRHRRRVLRSTCALISSGAYFLPRTPNRAAPPSPSTISKLTAFASTTGSFELPRRWGSVPVRPLPRAITELVLPRSIPTAVAMCYSLRLLSLGVAGRARPPLRRRRCRNISAEAW
jgi:hypothetical protein